MEKIEHSTIKTNGIKMHVASIGSGPAILFLHGFAELWYTWRHQLLSFSSLGYLAIAPDLRGYGDTDAPPSPSSYTAHHLVGDLIGLLDELRIEKVFLVGHNWGAILAWYFCLFRPERIKAVVSLSVQFLPRNPTTSFVAKFRATIGDDFYISRFQEPGKAEEDFASVDMRTFFKNLLSNRDPRAPYFPNEVRYKGIPPPKTLPSWLTEEDIHFYADKFKQTGFTGGLNYYRAFDLTWELTAPWTGAQVQVPAKLILGELDLTYHFPGVKEYIHNGGMKRDVPFLEEVIVMEDTCHYINQERPHETTTHIHDFFSKF